MKKFNVASIAFAAALGLAACSQNAENAAGNAADAIAADVNATMGEAVSDVDAAADQAFGAAENSADAAGAVIGNAADAAADATGDALTSAGNAIKN